MVTTGNLARIYYGLSTDTKPTKHVHNGSMYVEMNTGDRYYFDEEGKQWIKWGESSGGDDTIDLSNTVWTFNNDFSAESSALWKINFVCDNYTYDTISVSVQNGVVKLDYLDTSHGTAVKLGAYTSTTGWAGNAYKTISIIDGDDVTSVSLYDFLCAHAVEELLVDEEEVHVNPAT